MNINRNAEVSIHAQAADMEFVLDREGDNNWKLTVTDTGSESKPVRHFRLTNTQASCVMALFVGETDDDDKVLNNRLYHWAERVFENCPIEFRCIP